MASLPLSIFPGVLPSSPADRRARIGYASGNLGKSVVWTAFETLLLYYLVSVIGLSPGWAGALLTGALVWDAGAGFLLGYAFDRRGGDDRLVRVAAVAAPAAGAAFALIFLAPALDLPGAAAIAVAACLLCRLCYTLCDVAHNTLLLAMTPGGRGASAVSGYRLIFSAIGAALVGVAGDLLLALPHGDPQRHAFAVAGLAGGLCYACFVRIGTSSARGAARSAPPAHPVAPLRAAVPAILGDPAMRRLLALLFCQAGLLPLLVKAIPFAPAIGDAAGGALLTVTVAQAVAQPLWIGVVDRWLAPRQALMLCYAVLPLLVVALAGAPGRPLLLVLFGGAGVALAGMNMAIWAVMSATVQDGRFDGTGLRAAPVAMFLSVLKLAAGSATGSIAAALALGEWAGCDLLDIVRFGGPVLGAVLGLLLVARIEARQDVALLQR